MIITMHGSAFTSCHMTSYLTLHISPATKFFITESLACRKILAQKCFFLNRHISYHIQH